MKYIELTINCDEASVETLVEELSAKGYTDVLISDPGEIREMLENLEETEWYDSEQVDLNPRVMMPSVKLYFSDDDLGRCEAEKLSEELKSKDIGDLEATLVVRSDEEWKDNWKEFFKPAKVSDRVMVVPSWEDVPDAPEGSIVIRLDPGMAFGTGTHESTALAIRLMEKYVKEGSKVLDVGTGSGILAILASKLGAEDVLGIDIDEHAVETAKVNYEANIGSDNVSCNGKNNGISAAFVLGDLTEGVDYRADVVVANLLTDLVIRFTPDAKKHLVPQGIYISSGILEDHEERVVKALKTGGFTVEDILRDGEWISIAAKMK